jgi:hypothetical protein
MRTYAKRREKSEFLSVERGREGLMLPQRTGLLTRVFVADAAKLVCWLQTYNIYNIIIILLLLLLLLYTLYPPPSHTPASFCIHTHKRFGLEDRDARGVTDPVTLPVNTNVRRPSEFHTCV